MLLFLVFSFNTLYLNFEEDEYIYLKMLILILCNYYKIINDNITINSSTPYYKTTIIN